MVSERFSLDLVLSPLAGIKSFVTMGLLIVVVKIKNVISKKPRSTSGVISIFNCAFPERFFYQHLRVEVVVLSWLFQ